jgi:GT2 family glycosyltransferase
MVARSVWDAVGQWDDQFFLYSEETYFFRRVRAAGFTVWLEPAAEVEHIAGGGVPHRRVAPRNFPARLPQIRT